MNNILLIDYVKIILIIAVILCLYFIIIKFKKNNNSNNIINILDSYSINHKTSLYVVKIANEKFLIAQSSNNLVIKALKDHA